MTFITQRKARDINVTSIMMLLVWPIFALFYSIKNYQNTISKVLIVILYGHAAYFYHFDFNSDVDVVRHVENLRTVATYDTSYIADRVTNVFGSEEYKPDLFQPVLDFAISRFTTDHTIYLLILGMIMGCFLVAYLTKIHINFLKNPSIYIWLVFFLVLVIVPPYRVAGFRGVVAMLFFLHAAYKARVEDIWQYNFLILLTPMIHFGYFSVLPFYYLTLLIGSRYYAYIILIAIAYFVKDTIPSYISIYTLGVEGELGNRVGGYSSDRYIEQFNVSRVGVLAVVRYQMQWTVIAFTILFGFLFKNLKNANIETKRMFTLVLSFLILLTLIMNLEVVFVRFSLPFALLSCLVTAMLLSSSSFRLTWIPKTILISIFVFNFVVMARKSIEYTGVEVLLPNFILSFFIDMDSSILDLIK